MELVPEASAMRGGNYRTAPIEVCIWIISSPTGSTFLINFGLDNIKYINVFWRIYMKKLPVT